METATEPRGTLGAQVAQLKGKIPLKKTDRERSAELTAMKVGDLRVIAKELGLTGYSSMKKDELVAAIVTDEIENGSVIAAQPDMPAADAKGTSNGNGTATQAASAASKEITVGDELTGTVSGVNFAVGGMFVTLVEGKSGLVHERQIVLEGESRRTTMARLDTAFKQGDTVNVRVTRIAWNQDKKKHEIGLELVGASRELFKNAQIQQQEEREQTAAGNGESAGATSTSTSDTAIETAGAGDKPVQQRQTSPDDEVMFRAKGAVGPMADILLALDLERVVEEGLHRSGGDTLRKVRHLKGMLAERGVDGVRAFIDGFKHDAWTGRVFSRKDAKQVAFAFTGIALGCLPGMPPQHRAALWAAIQPFMSGTDLPPEQRAYDFADIVGEEIALARQVAAENRVERVKAAVSAFDLVSSGRPKPLAKDARAAGNLQIGMVYDGKVVNVPEQGYGVFVEFEGGHKGLVHISSMPGKPSREELERQYPADKSIRVKLIEKTDRGFALQFEEHAATVTVEPRTERGPFPKQGNVYLGIVDRIGKLGDTIVVGIDGHKGIILTTEIGWGQPGRTDREREEFRGRLGMTYSSGKQIPVEVTGIEKRWNGHLGKDVTYILLKPIEPTEYARRKGGSHGQTGGGSRTASTAKPAADDAEAERASASPAAEEQRQTLEVNLDTVTEQPVECKQDPESGTCAVHTNGSPVKMMPGERFCGVGWKLIRQGGVPVEKEEVATEPAMDSGGATGEPEATAKVMRRGDGNVPSVMINTVTLGELNKFLDNKEVTENDREILDEVRALVSGRMLLTKEQAWARKEAMIALARKYGANDGLVERLTRRFYGTPEQVEHDARIAGEKAYRERLVETKAEFVCMANGGLGGHKAPWFMGAGRTNQLHPELAEILTAVVPENHSKRPMATRIAKEAEDGLPFCLQCADIRLGWVEGLLAENGLVKGEAYQRLLDICPANNSGRRPRVFWLINREPHMRAQEAYEEALAIKAERDRAVAALKDPAPNQDDDEETARARQAARHRNGGAFSQDPRPAADYAGRKKDKAAQDVLIRATMRGGSGGGKQKPGGDGKKSKKGGKKK